MENNLDRFKFRVAVKQQDGSFIITKVVNLNNYIGDITVDYRLECDDWFEEIPVDNENIILLQCTGVKDKNKKLIFEGDIIKYYQELSIVKFGCYNIRMGDNYANNNYGFFLHAQKYIGGLIDSFTEFHAFQGYGLRYPVRCCDKEQNWKNFIFEVIGNIYENKELLECNTSQV